MARIIVEGPDGAGKSYTVSRIRETVFFPLYPTQGPPKNPTEIIRRVMTTLDMDNHIFDRFPLISELVYGEILRTPIFDPLWLSRLLNTDIIIYCRPPRVIILNSVLSAKPHKSEEHVELVRQKHSKIIDRYDFIFEKIELLSRARVIRFNREERSLEDLCAELICVLAEKKLN